MTEITDHDAYIAAAPEPLRPLLARLRVQLARILPDAEEIIAYKMPEFSRPRGTFRLTAIPLLPLRFSLID